MEIQSLLINILILAVSAIVITKSIRLFISSSSKLAHMLKLSEYTISFLLISIATSLPELVVAITSGLEKNSILSYGDALGSNLALLTIILALPILFGKKLSTKDIIKTKDIYYSAFFLILALGMALDGVLTRLDGAFLLIGYLFYSRSVLKRASFFESIKDTLEHTNVWKQSVLFFTSLGLLLLASEAIVRTAINISSLMDISLGFVGLTMTAIGTSLPEIAFAFGILKTKGNEDEILGDIIGSVVANSTIVLGTAAMIYPINLASDPKLGFPTILVVFATLVLFLVFSKTDTILSKKEALVLLLIYFLFISVEYIVLIL
jgi:cation:H+ antiporter